MNEATTGFTGGTGDAYHPLRYPAERGELLACLHPWEPDWRVPHTPEPSELAFVLERFRDYVDGDRMLAQRELALLFRVLRWHRRRHVVMPDHRRLAAWFEAGPGNVTLADLAEPPALRYVEAPLGWLDGLNVRGYLLEGVYTELQASPRGSAGTALLHATAVWHKPGLRGERLTFMELRELPDFHLELRLAGAGTRLMRALAEGLRLVGPDAAPDLGPEVRSAVLALAVDGLLEMPFEL